MNKKIGYWWALHKNSTEEEIIYVGKEEDFLSPDYEFLRPVAKYHELTSRTYQEGVLATENTDMNPIMERLSYVKMARLLHAGMGLNTEASEFIDQLKKHIFYGKELDEVNLIEELGDLQWYTMLALDVLGVSLEDVWKRNRNKLLKKRYKNGFTKDAALNRNLEAERKALEVKGELDRITIGSDVKHLEIHSCPKGTGPCDGNCNGSYETFYISDEELEYQMRPSLEADINYLKYED